MSFTLLQNFDCFEHWTLNGNAALSDFHKFGKKSVLFHDWADSVSVSNQSGLFNLSSLSRREFECFLYPEHDLSSDSFSFFNGHSFKLIHFDNISWHDAQSFCKRLGGHLATSTSQEKNNFLTALTDSHIVWIGGTNEGSQNGSWRWVTGEPFSFSNWGANQPDNTGGIQFFINLFPNSSWADSDNESKTLAYDNSYFICEWDYDLSASPCLPGFILQFGHELSLLLNHDATLSFLSDSWNINLSSSETVSPHSWNHIVLRIDDNNVNVFLNGNLVISSPFNGDDVTPDALTLGGFHGYLDNFAVRDNPPLSIPVVPNRPYETVLRLSSAPVTSAVWFSSNLPQGLTLSTSGLLEGRPTQSGTFNCNVQLSNNWGNTNKSIRIVIQ